MNPRATGIVTACCIWALSSLSACGAVGRQPCAVACPHHQPNGDLLSTCPATIPGSNGESSPDQRPKPERDEPVSDPTTTDNPAEAIRQCPWPQAVQRLPSGEPVRGWQCFEMRSKPDDAEYDSTCTRTIELCKRYRFRYQRRGLHVTECIPRDTASCFYVENALENYGSQICTDTQSECLDRQFLQTRTKDDVMSPCKRIR